MTCSSASRAPSHHASTLWSPQTLIWTSPPTHLLARFQCSALFASCTPQHRNTAGVANTLSEQARRWPRGKSASEADAASQVDSSSREGVAAAYRDVGITGLGQEVMQDPRSESYFNAAWVGLIDFPRQKLTEVYLTPERRTSGVDILKDKIHSGRARGWSMAVAIRRRCIFRLLDTMQSGVPSEASAIANGRRL
jgi:hypothetical protein